MAAGFDIWESFRRRIERRLRSPGRRALARFEERHREAIAVLGRAGHQPEGRHLPDAAVPLPNVWLECTRCGAVAHSGPSGLGLTGPMTRQECRSGPGDAGL